MARKRKPQTAKTQRKRAEPLGSDLPAEFNAFTRRVLAYKPPDKP